jgi:hypothetical protein
LREKKLRTSKSPYYFIAQTNKIERAKSFPLFYDNSNNRLQLKKYKTFKIQESKPDLNIPHMGLLLKKELMGLTENMRNKFNFILTFAQLNSDFNIEKYKINGKSIKYANHNDKQPELVAEQSANSVLG